MASRLWNLGLTQSVQPRVALLIAALGRGGAERQLMRLASGLNLRGFLVEIWCYGGATALDDELRTQGIVVRNESAGSQWAKVKLIRTWMAAFKPNLIHGFMKRASSLAVLARGFSRRPIVIGSDLSTATYGKRDFTLWSSLVLFAFAQCISTQTELNRQSLQRLAPWLRRRVRVVRNGLDLSRFTPLAGTRTPGPLRFVCVGSVYAVKNPLRVVQAVVLLKQTGVNVRLDWFGRLGLGGDSAPSEDYQACQALIEREGLKEHICFHGECIDILEAYQSADVLIHASVQEGFPNAVVEGMACGLPVVVSRVSDLPLAVREANNGFVFDEREPREIAAAMRRIMDLPEAERTAMGRRSRELAERWFGLDRFVDEYQALYLELLGEMA